MRIDNTKILAAAYNEEIGAERRGRSRRQRPSPGHGEARGREVPELVDPCREPAEQHTHREEPGPSVPYEAGPQEEQPEGREVDHEQWVRPPAKTCEQAQNQERTRTPGAPEEKGVCSEEEQVANQEREWGS